MVTLKYIWLTCYLLELFISDLLINLRIESLSLPALLDSVTSPHSPYEFNKLIISSEENKIK